MQMVYKNWKIRKRKFIKYNNKTVSYNNKRSMQLQKYIKSKAMCLNTIIIANYTRTLNAF